MAIPGGPGVATGSPGGPPATTGSGTPPTQQGVGAGPKFVATSGWYVFLGVGTGILVSGTEIAPVALGILTVALLYQISQLIEGK